MAENDRETEVTDKVRLPDGTIVKEFTNPETGNVTYRRNGQFISPDVAEGLKQTTELGGAIEVDEELTQSELNEYGAGITAEELRERRIENKYTQWDDVTGIDTRRIPGGESGRKQRWIQGWMDNNEVRQQVRNDPLLESKQEQRRAEEALAREIVNRLEGVRSQNEAIEVLRDYGIY